MLAEEFSVAINNMPIQGPLTLVLKVKDDFILMKHWLEYHSAIVGQSNIIILDCGSTSSEQLNYYSQIKNTFKIFRYKEFYNNIHATKQNRYIFDLICKPNSYISILDSDEYLFGVMNSVASPGNVLDVIRSESADIYAGTWFFNITEPKMEDDAIDWSCPIEFALDAEFIKSGTVSGKSLVRSSIIYDVEHLGHNLHVKEVVQRLQKESFGKIGILHVQNFEIGFYRKKVLKHLIVHGVLPDRDITEAEAIHLLNKKIQCGDIDNNFIYYAKTYVSGPPCPSGNVFKKATVEINPEIIFDRSFIEALSLFNFHKLFGDYRSSFNI